MIKEIVLCNGELLVKDNDISQEQVWNYVGGDSVKSYELVALIHELVAGHVSLSVLRDQIIEFNREEEDA